MISNYMIWNLPARIGQNADCWRQITNLPCIRFAAVLFLSALSLTPQTQDPLIRVEINLRQVDLVVDDAQGHRVTDLQPGDFQVLEDGGPQKITNFSWIVVTPPPTGARLKGLQEKPSLMEKFGGVPRFTKTPGNDILAAPVANPRKTEIRRTVVFVIDGANPPAVERVRKFIDEQVAPGDMISIRSTARSVIHDRGTTTIRDSMGIFEQFTNDKRQLDAAMWRILRTCDFIHTCVADVPGTLTAAIRSLQGVPGRKAIVFVGGYRGPVERIVSLANQAGVVIDVVNPSGTPLNPMQEGFPGAEPVVELARHTGGRWLLSTVGFDMTTALNDVMEDLSGYYLLGYHATESADELASGTPVRHRIEVKVLRAGLVVHARNGSLGRPDAAPAATTKAAGRDEALTDAMFSAFTADGIRVHLEPSFTAGPSDPGTKRRSPVVRAALDIDGRDVSFEQLEGGHKKKLVLDVALAVFNADGTQAGAKNQTFTVTVPPEKIDQLVKMGMQYKVEIPVLNSGAYQIRAAVRDAASGQLGSAYAFLDIPDLSGRKPVLSSLFLSAPPAAGGATRARPEWNEFVAGTAIQFRCEALGLKMVGKPPDPPNVDYEVKIYRGEGPVVSGGATAALIETGKDGNLFLNGSFLVPTDLEPGNYELEMTAYDRLEPVKKQIARQWIDLTVVSSRENGQKNQSASYAPQ